MQAVKEQTQKAAKGEDSQAEKYLTFFIDHQLYCVPTSEIVEIIQMQRITFMPNVTDYVKGVINLRGKVVPVIDMRLRFNREEAAYTSSTSIVIAKSEDMMVGMIVDSVQDVCDVAADQISGSPQHENSAGRDAHFVRGIVSLGSTSAMLLNTKKVLTHHSRSQRQKAEANFQTANAPQPSSPQP